MSDKVEKGRTRAAPFIPADTDSAVFLGNPHIDNLVSVVIALGSEIWADRQRMRVVERLLESEGKATTAMIEAYVPSPAEKEAWEAERMAMVERVYSMLSRDTSGARPFGEERQFEEEQI